MGRNKKKKKGPLTTSDLTVLSASRDKRAHFKQNVAPLAVLVRISSRFPPFSHDFEGGANDEDLVPRCHVRYENASTDYRCTSLCSPSFRGRVIRVARLLILFILVPPRSADRKRTRTQWLGKGHVTDILGNIMVAVRARLALNLGVGKGLQRCSSNSGSSRGSATQTQSPASRPHKSHTQQRAPLASPEQWLSNGEQA